MTLSILRNRIHHDLKALGVDTESFELVLKPYSKTYYGSYVPEKKRVILYVFEDSERTTLFSYESLFSTAVHEVVHHIQWSNPEWKRVKGIMHDAEFYKTYNRLLRKHKIYSIVKRGDFDDTFSKEVRH